MNSELKEKLTQLAFNRSSPFCYNCYHDCPSGRCGTCGSDDLMRSVDGVGCEYGAEWVIKHILETELTHFDLEESFEDMIRECYPETTKVGWLEFDTVTLMKENDPVSWRCALSEFESQELDEERVVTLDGSNFYYINDIENLLPG